MSGEEPRDPESLVLNLVFLGPLLVFAVLVGVAVLQHEALVVEPLAVALGVALVVILIAFPLLRRGFRE